MTVRTAIKRSDNLSELVVLLAANRPDGKLRASFGIVELASMQLELLFAVCKLFLERALRGLFELSDPPALDEVIDSSLPALLARLGRGEGRGRNGLCTFPLAERSEVLVDVYTKLELFRVVL